jgi:hypothetical protein
MIGRSRGLDCTQGAHLNRPHGANDNGTGAAARTFRDSHRDEADSTKPRTRTRTNAHSNDTEPSAAGRSGNARALRARQNCKLEVCRGEVNQTLRSGGSSRRISNRKTAFSRKSAIDIKHITESGAANNATIGSLVALW